MATDLTSWFGPNITVHRQPYITENQINGFPSAHGVTIMQLGTRGAPLIIRGRLYATGANYEASRANLDDWIYDIETLLWSGPGYYYYKGSYYNDLQFLRMELIPGAGGRVYHFDSNWVFVDFVMYGHILI